MEQNPLNGFFSDIQAGLKQQRAARKSDDIIEFIESHWRFFVSRRREMKEALAQLGTPQFPYTVDSLCDLLGIPDNVYFKRLKCADVGAEVLSFGTSKLLKTFEDCLAMGHREVLLFAVAGKKSICVTNMQTSFAEGQFICYIKRGENDRDIHLFLADQAQERLPSLLTPTERY